MAGRTASSTRTRSRPRRSASSSTPTCSSRPARSPAELIAAGQWTWDEAIAAGAAVSAKTGKAGLVVRDFDYKGWDNLSTVWTGWGAEAVERGRQDLRLRPAADGRRDDLPAQGDLHRQGDARPGRRPPTSSPATPAMTITQISRASLLKDAKFGWDLVPLPAGPERRVLGDRPGRHRACSSRASTPTRRRTSWPSSPTPPTRPSSPQFFPPPRTSQLTADDPGQDQPAAQARAAAERRHRRHRHAAWSSPATPARPSSPRRSAPRSTRCGSRTPTSRPCSPACARDPAAAGASDARRSRTPADGRPAGELRPRPAVLDHAAPRPARRLPVHRPAAARQRRLRARAAGPGGLVQPARVERARRHLRLRRRRQLPGSWPTTPTLPSRARAPPDCSPSAWSCST